MSLRNPFSKAGTSTQDRAPNYVGFETIGVAKCSPLIWQPPPNRKRGL
jgi:hypothetical protein